jgi:hypothetical protein
MQITGYKIDLSKPYRIIHIDNEKQTVHIDGCSRIIEHPEEGEYGGICGIWKDIPFDKLLTNKDKEQLRTIGHSLGSCARQERKKQILSARIAEHSNHLIAW